MNPPKATIGGLLTLLQMSPDSFSNDDLKDLLEEIKMANKKIKAEKALEEKK